jgi:hypothetical protein
MKGRIDQKDGPTVGRPYRLRVPWVSSNEDIGLGDVIKGAVSSVGVRHCGGCDRRAAELNRWIVFSRRR